MPTGKPRNCVAFHLEHFSFGTNLIILRCGLYPWAGGFRIVGKISTQCSLSDTVSGDITVEASAVPIQSIDIQLLRVESILAGDRIVMETSVIQTTQASNIVYLVNLFSY